ncbi:MAG: hypothetical protein Ct9H300mP27_11520 [Chloroflexota bacterium]|nr:MAG: hypothetical protein Ct9H300mP27_11520 [Chloroflexota bacterium]
MLLAGSNRDPGLLQADTRSDDELAQDLAEHIPFRKEDACWGN